MKSMTLGAVLVALVPLLLAGRAPAQTPDKPVATVNGEKISEQAFVDTLKARYGDRVINAMVNNLAVRQAAKAAGITVTKDELERRFTAAQRTIEMRSPVSGENFEYWLAKQALTKDYFRTELYDQMLLEKMVQSQVKVSDQDVSTFYQRNRDQLAEPATVRVAHICVKTQQEATGIRADIMAGKISFEDAAKKYSLDPWTRDVGGDMGFVALADTDFHRAIFALAKNGDISAPVQSPMGYHLLKRLAYKEARTPPFEELEASIRDQLALQQLKHLSIQKRNDILKAAKTDIQVQIAPEGPPPAAATANP